MSQTVTLTLPDSFFQPIKRTAQATNQPIEELLVQALQASLPPLEGLPEDLIEILTYNKLHYNHASESGVLFHLIGALSEFGKVGVTAIANSREEVDDLYVRTLEVLDRETVYGR